MFPDKIVILVLAFLPLLPGSSEAREDFISDMGKWRYLNGEVIPPEEWKDNGFDDSKWLSGEAPLGYGNYQLRTQIRSTGSPRPITAYFRSSFIVNDPGEWEELLLKYKADDGAVVYLNGERISSFNMPSGAVDANTTALRTISGWVPSANETLPRSAFDLLVKGKNTIAVSAHQINPTSSDLNFSFSLTGVEKDIETKELMDLRSPWRYSDQARLPDDDWMSLEYDDQAWKTGQGVFGYGNPDVETTLDFGGDPSDKPICAWFRKEFTIERDMDVRAILMKVRFDDAITIFLNGEEINRHNLPYGYSDSRTFANAEFNDWSNKNQHSLNLPAREVLPGRNVIAVQIHLADAKSPDMCFAMNSLKVEYLTRSEAGPAIVRKAPDKDNKKEAVKISDLASVTAAGASDWMFSSGKFIDIAVDSYEKNQLEFALRGYCVSRWSEIFAREGSILLPGLKAFLLAEENLRTAREYLDLFSHYDDHPRVYEILNTLFAEEGESFRTYANLGMAIALVYDQKPPGGWPHHQVDAAVLPRRLPDPLAAFRFWVASDKAGKTLHKLGELGIGELKYVVDTPVSLADLAKAQKLRVRLRNIKDLYPGIVYSHDRLKERRYDWPYRDYGLEKIKELGGICVDQAYYTSQVAKACGVPAMMVSGAGSNGNHAWVGFLDQRERWDFSTGRYEASKFVTGVTFDPQTWQQPTDHEIALLTERFQTSPRYLVSRIHSIFALEYLEREEIAEAIKACHLAIKSESRNFEAWDLLIKAQKKAKVREEVLRDIYQKGAKTFSGIADLEAHFLKREATSLIHDGAKDEAEKIRARIISRNRRERPDLALEESKGELDKLIESGSIEEQIAFYKQQIQKLKDAGLVTYYGLTRPFLEHLVSEKKFEEAKEALEYTERKMEVSPDGQLAEEISNWKYTLSGE